MRMTWIIACALGEALGIALVATTYAALDRGLIQGAAFWILAVGAWEGLCLGGAQAAVLRRAGVRPLAWTALTVFGAVLGYGLSLVGGAGQGGESGADAGLSLGALILLAAAMGLAMGALMGLSQWASAPARIKPLRWISANAVGWAPAMIVIMLAANLAQRSWTLSAIAVLGAGAGALAGLLVGAATSVALPSAEADRRTAKLGDS